MNMNLGSIVTLTLSVAATLWVGYLTGRPSITKEQQDDRIYGKRESPSKAE